MDQNQSKVISKSIKIGQIYKRSVQGQVDLTAEENAFNEFKEQLESLRRGQPIDADSANVYLRDALDQIEHETLLRTQRRLVGADISMDFDSEAYRIEHRYKDYMVIEYENGEMSPRFTTVKDGELLERFPAAVQADKIQHRVYDYDEQPANFHVKQWRKMKQSKFFITYVLHKPAVDDDPRGHNEYVSLQFARAVRRMTLDANLCPMVRFGYKLGPDKKPKLIDALKEDGEDYKHSYTADTWVSHMHYVTVDCGVEIAPSTKNFHFHMILSFTHWSKLQLDTMQLKAWLERSFKGLHPDENDNFFIEDVNGQQWYGDQENAYIDLRLLPQDNFHEVIARYIRKTHTATVAQRDATRGRAQTISRQPAPRVRTTVDELLDQPDQQPAQGVDDLNRDN